MTDSNLHYLPASASSIEVLDGLRRHGHVIVESIASELTARAADELAPFFERTPRGTGSFAGQHTQRVNRLIARSAACRELAMLPVVLEAVTRAFEGACYHPQLALTQAIRIHPGESAQSLHRDDNAFFFKHPRPPAVINTMWALDDFTEDNGATQLVAKSHLWDDQRQVDPASAVPAVMPRGSLLIWDGALYHGGGTNNSRQSRTGIILAYNLGWLRQYENMYLSVPPDVARTLSPELQQLIGYRNHGYLGTYEGNDPRRWLEDPEAPPLPAPDLFTPELESIKRQRV